MTLISDHIYGSIGASPVSEANPCGENIRYEPEFEQLEAELAKQESLSAETVDWQLVAKLSSQIIDNSSKDLLVGTYLCQALLMTEGFAGLAVGLHVLNELVENFWDGLFPPLKRMRARQTAFAWLAEKAGQYLSEHPPGASDGEAILAAAEAIKALDSLLVEKMGDQAPMLTDISRPLKNYSQSALAEREKAEKVAESTPEVAAEKAPEIAVENTDLKAAEAPPPAVEKTPVASVPKAAPEAPVISGTLESDADSKKILRQLQTTMRDISSFWITARLSDPRPYRQARVAAWMVVENVPPDNDGVTQINPPAAERLKYFESQQEKKDHASLIPELEKTLARAPFWLDGHFLVIKSLRQLGVEYDEVVQTIIRELSNFLDRLPQTMQLSFSDGTPFASDQTRMWIDAEVLGSRGGSAQSSDSSQGTGDAWSTALSKAKQLAASGDTEQAVQLLKDGISNSAQLRDQFQWRCALAELLLQTGGAETAASILEQVGKQAGEIRLADWEPSLLAKIYNLLFQSYQKQKKLKKDDKSLDAKLEHAFEQLCWFDPIAALSVKGG